MLLFAMGYRCKSTKFAAEATSHIKQLREQAPKPIPMDAEGEARVEVDKDLMHQVLHASASAIMSLTVAVEDVPEKLRRNAPAAQLLKQVLMQGKVKPCRRAQHLHHACDRHT